MSSLIQCDECKKTIPLDDPKFDSWYSIIDYEADVCSKECYEKLVTRKEKTND